MPKKSAGLLVFRRRNGGLEVFLVHPGGPLWSTKDEGAWSIPKGEFTDEDALTAARREFEEETGVVPSGEFIPLELVRQQSGKVVHAWALEADVDATAIVSNTFQLEWPPRSAKLQEFPEVDRADWFSLDHARSKINKGQVPLLDQLRRIADDTRG